MRLKRLLANRKLRRLLAKAEKEGQYVILHYKGIHIDALHQIGPSRVWRVGRDFVDLGDLLDLPSVRLSFDEIVDVEPASPLRWTD